MNKVVLAFSGGLDTSYCALYLANELHMEVHTVVVNTGGFSNEDLQAIADRAHACSVASHTTLDCTDQLYNEVLRYCIAGNVLKNATYPLSVSAERTVQAQAIATHAMAIGATHVAHGSTGAGNDQVRFDVTFRTMCPQIEVLTPIRDLNLSRDAEIAYLTAHGVQGDWTKAQYSINQGIWGTTIGGRETLTSSESLPEHAWWSAQLPSPNAPTVDLVVGFEKGHPVSLNGETMAPVEVIKALNIIGASYRIGRNVHVGDTIIGIKGRVAFEAPAALLLIASHHLLEKHTLSKWQLNLKDQLAIWYGQLLHEGQFFDPAMRSIEQFFEHTQLRVTGTVSLRLQMQQFTVLGCSSPHDLMNSGFASYGEENHAWSGDDAKGYAAIASIPARVHQANHDS